MNAKHRLPRQRARHAAQTEGHDRTTPQETIVYPARSGLA
jgi:hypothetical protein